MNQFGDRVALELSIVKCYIAVIYLSGGVMIGPKITTSRLIFTVFILFVFTATAFEYVYADDPRNKPAIDKLLEKNQQVIDKIVEKIGTRYWVLKNDQLKFYQTPVLFSEYFLATQTQSFIIKGWISADKNYSQSGSFYEVEFESGEISYVRADTFSTYWALYKDFLRTGDPQAVEEELKIEAAKKDAYELSLKQEQEKRRQEQEKIKLDEEKKKKKTKLLKKRRKKIQYGNE